MRKTAFAGTVILALSLALTACSADDMSGDAMTDESSASSEMQDDEMADEMADEARSGEFEGLNDKAVSGSVEVSATEVALSGFSSDEGPDLHVYLTNGSDEAAVESGVEIDIIAFDEASQTFALDGVEVGDYDTVVIHCDKAKAVFGAATLA